MTDTRPKVVPFTAADKKELNLRVERDSVYERMMARKRNLYRVERMAEEREYLRSQLDIGWHIDKIYELLSQQWGFRTPAFDGNGTPVIDQDGNQVTITSVDRGVVAENAKKLDGHFKMLNKMLPDVKAYEMSGPLSPYAFNPASPGSPSSSSSYDSGYPLDFTDEMDPEAFNEDGSVNQEYVRRRKIPRVQIVAFDGLQDPDEVARKTKDRQRQKHDQQSQEQDQDIPDIVTHNYNPARSTSQASPSPPQNPDNPALPRFNSPTGMDPGRPPRKVVSLHGNAPDPRPGMTPLPPMALPRPDPDPDTQGQAAPTSTKPASAPEPVQTILPKPQDVVRLPKKMLRSCDPFGGDSSDAFTTIDVEPQTKSNLPEPVQTSSVESDTGPDFNPMDYDFLS